jgi:hypothetical protein
MVLNEYGQIANEEWARSAPLRQELELDTLIIMPTTSTPSYPSPMAIQQRHSRVPT